MRSNDRTGWYLRVLEPGEVTVGSAIDVVETDPRSLSVLDAHEAMGDRHRVRRDLVAALAEHPALAAECRVPLQERLARHGA